jgi:MFS family permease
MRAIHHGQVPALNTKETYMSKNTLARVDRSAYASMFLYASAANALPICLVMLSRELGFNLTQAGLLGFITSLEQFFVLILSSFLAARFGKIRILKTALLIVALGLFAFSFTRNYLSTVSLMLLIGIGYAFLEALLTPLVQDLHPGDAGSRMNLMHAFWPTGVFVSVLLVGELLSRGVSWRAVFAGLSVVALAVFFTYPSSRCHASVSGFSGRRSSSRVARRSRSPSGRPATYSCTSTPCRGQARSERQSSPSAW